LIDYNRENQIFE